MKTNEVLAKQNFITKIQFKGDDGTTLSKELKVKIMAMRIEYAKIRKSFDEDLQEFVKGATPEGLQELNSKPEEERTDAEKEQLKELLDKLNTDYNAYVATRGQEEVTINHSTLTEDEYNEIVAVMAGTDVNINGQEIPSADFLEILYTLFVTE